MHEGDAHARDAADIAGAAARLGAVADRARDEALRRAAELAASDNGGSNEALPLPWLNLDKCRPCLAQLPPGRRAALRCALQGGVGVGGDAVARFAWRAQRAFGHASSPGPDQVSR
eukprot:2232815-Pyramimonas_sp.AAC.2